LANEDVEIFVCFCCYYKHLKVYLFYIALDVYYNIAVNCQLDLLVRNTLDVRLC